MKMIICARIVIYLFISYNICDGRGKVNLRV